MGKGPEIGGYYRHRHYTLEGFDTRKHLEKLLGKVEGSDRITAYTGSRAAKIEGFIGNYKTTVATPEGDREFDHGVVIVATGGEEMETSEYMYGQSERVVTQLREEGLEPFPISLRGINWIKFLTNHKIENQKTNNSLSALSPSGDSL